jgi:hypothetical protein
MISRALAGEQRVGHPIERHPDGDARRPHDLLVDDACAVGGRKRLGVPLLLHEQNALRLQDLRQPDVTGAPPRLLHLERLVVGLVGLAIAAEIPERHRGAEVEPAEGVVRRRQSVGDGDGAPRLRQGGLESTHRPVRVSQVQACDRHVRVCGAERRLLDRERPLDLRERILLPAHLTEDAA